MDDDGSEDEEHFSHTGTASCHFLFAFFEEPLMEFLKNWYVFDSDHGVQVEDLAKSAGRTSAHERGVDA